MAEIDFFATESEKIAIVRHIFDRGCKMIPDLHYVKPIVDEIVRLDDLCRYTDRVSQFFIINDDLLESPLELRKVEKDHSSFYYVFPRGGGPILLLFWGKEYLKEGRKNISATTISYYPWYESSRTRERMKPSKEIVAIYNEASRAVRAVSRRIQPGVRPYWITPQAEDLVRKGASLVGLESFSTAELLA